MIAAPLLRLPCLLCRRPIAHTTDFQTVSCSSASFSLDCLDKECVNGRALQGGMGLDLIVDRIREFDSRCHVTAYPPFWLTTNHSRFSDFWQRFSSASIAENRSPPGCRTISAPLKYKDSHTRPVLGTHPRPFMSDPYFQQLFADRIGGAELRQRHRDLQVREDQAGEAEGPGRAPRAEAGRFRHRRKRRNGRRQRPPRDGRRDRQAGEPRLCRQRHRRLQGGRRPLHAARVPGGTRSGCARSTTASARRRRWPCCPRPSSIRAT